MPIGTSTVTAIAIRTGRANGIAQFTSGVTPATHATPMSAMPAIVSAVERFKRGPASRRLNAAPNPVPRRSEKSVTVRAKTGWPSSSTNRWSTATSMSMKPAPSAPKYPSHASHPAGRLPAATASGPRTKSTTSAPEMPISVSSALRPLPNSIERPKATSNWSASFVV